MRLHCGGWLVAHGMFGDLRAFSIVKMTVDKSVPLIRIPA